MKQRQKNTEDSSELLEFISQLAGDEYLKIEENLGSGYFRLNISEAERRQARHDIRWVEDILIELLRNSRDAEATKIFVSSHKSEDKNREIIVIDDGIGIPSSLHQKVFEPRVTSKLDNVVLDKYGVHGRGMALFSISSAAKVAYVVSSDFKKGSVFKIKVDTNELPERKDQSTYPVIGFRNGAPVLLRGPHNAIWFLSEFSHAYPEIEVYYGSPAEIASTIYHLAFPQDNDLPVDLNEMYSSDGFCVWRYLGAASGARDLVDIARDFLGLEISERNAYRIIQGEIKPLPSLKEHLGLEHEDVSSERISFQRSKKVGLTRHLCREDIAKLTRVTSACAQEMAQKYFMHLPSEPKIIKSGNRIKIILTLAADEEI